jgi:tetratricopeptide (TPR) repeat protein
LRDLLSAIAAGRPVILWIDDAQWGDADSATLLRIVLEPSAHSAASPITLALSYRPEAERSSPVVRALLADARARPGDACVALSLQPLTGDAAARLAADLLSARGVNDSATVAAIARDSGGSPFFIGELARSDVDLTVAGSALRTERALGVASVVRKRFERLRGGAREILELVALAGAPLAEPLALRAAGVDRAGAGDVDDLERLCLLRTYDTAEERMLQPYHDRIAEAVRDALSAPRQRALHGAIAAALEEQPDAEPELLVFHYRGAEATALAARHAQRAARRAYAALAFDRAAEMFQFAALHTDQDAARAPLWAGLAESLASAGRGEDAARAFETAADAVPDHSADVQALDYRRRAAEQLLKCGHVTGGITRMRDVLAFFRERLPETPGEGMRSLLLQRGRLALRGLRFVDREASARLRPYEAARLDAMWATCISVSMVNPTLSVALSTRHLIDVLDSGDKPRICQALAHEAAWRTSFGRRYHRGALGILDTARDLARELGTPYERAWASMAEGVMHWQSGRWREAISPLDSALAIYRTECRSVFFEIAIVHMYLYASLALAGEIARLRSTLLGETAVDQRRNDRFALHGALLGESVVGWLADGDAASVLARADEVISEWPAGSFLMQHYHHLTTTVQADIYLGNGAGAWRRMTAAWPRLIRAGFLNLDCPALGLRFLRARAALALLATDATPTHRRTRLAGVRREARRMERSTLPAARAFSAIVRAGVAAAGGDTEGCAAELRAARAAAGYAHMPLHGAAAEIALGHVIGGDEGDALAGSGRTWMAAQGIADPERMSATVCPVHVVRLRAT